MRPTRADLIRELDMAVDQRDLARFEAVRYRQRAEKLEALCAAFKRFADVLCAQRDAAGTPGGPAQATVALLNEQWLIAGERVEALMRELFAREYEMSDPKTTTDRSAN